MSGIGTGATTGGAGVPIAAHAASGDAVSARPPWRAWVAVAALYALCAVGGWWMPRATLDWQPSLLGTQPWRLLTPIGVHYGSAHLIANLAGVALAAAYGVVGLVPARIALAWLASWPLTHLALLARPDLLHYGGLSGVLHAGVAAATVWLGVRAQTGAQRAVAAVVATGLILKVVGEQPWGPALRQVAGWDFPVAPLVHATGVLAGTACALASIAIGRRRGHG